MSFGKNPYVPKAQAAELKAQEAPDAASRERAYRDAAHQWDRAAARENPGKKRSEYEQNAAQNRELADGGEPNEAHEASDEVAHEAPSAPSVRDVSSSAADAAAPRKLMN